MTTRYAIRGQRHKNGPIISLIPRSLEDAQISVCGVKGFMIDELRRFGKKMIRCASIATLKIKDSPIHVHGYTWETYIILSGSGLMVLGQKIERVSRGTVILIPPGFRHGLWATNHRPVKVLMTFNPGLAPKSKPGYRDEYIIYLKASDLIKSMFPHHR